MEERRAARRYDLALEIKLQSELKQFQPIPGFTRDISLNGFYFGTSQNCEDGLHRFFGPLEFLPALR